LELLWCQAYSTIVLQRRVMCRQLQSKLQMKQLSKIYQIVVIAVILKKAVMISAA